MSLLANPFDTICLQLPSAIIMLLTLLTELYSCRTYDASGHDMHSLLFNFLDELLFVFSTELFVPAELSITQFDRSEWRIQATG